MKLALFRLSNVNKWKKKFFGGWNICGWVYRKGKWMMFSEMQNIGESDRFGSRCVGLCLTSLTALYMQEYKKECLNLKYSKIIFFPRQSRHSSLLTSRFKTTVMSLFIRECASEKRQEKEKLMKILHKKWIINFSTFADAFQYYPSLRMTKNKKNHNSKWFC